MQNYEKIPNYILIMIKKDAFGSFFRTPVFDGFVKDGF